MRLERVEKSEGMTDHKTSWAVQQLSAENDALKKRLEKLEAK